MPTSDLSWVQVASVDDTLAKVTEAGGNVVARAFQVPLVGRLGILADNTGGVIGVVTPPAQA